MAKIYTKHGDQGKSSLFGGQAVDKSDQRLEAYGTLDELNSILGLVRSEAQNMLPALDQLDSDLEKIQNYIFNVGSHLACGSEEMKSHLPKLEELQTVFLENQIDKMEETLSPLKNFILPGGSKASSLLHLARTIARRAERSTVAIGPQVDAIVLIYLNRLSDYLFVAARFANARLGTPDVLWSKNPSA